MKITEVTPQKNNPQRVSVYLDGEYVLSLDDVDALVLGIKPGREIDEAELTNLLFESQFGKAKAKALDILSRKSISSRCLCDELAKKGYDSIVIREVIGELEELGYIDDYSYTLMFLEHAAEKMWGKRKIVYELTNKGVDMNTIEDAMSEFELPGAREVADAIRTRYAGEDLGDFKVKQRIMRFFASRGFEISAVEDALRIIKD